MYVEQDGIDAVMYAVMSFSGWKSISTTLIVNLSINTIVCTQYFRCEMMRLLFETVLLRSSMPLGRSSLCGKCGTEEYEEVVLSREEKSP